MCEGGRPQVSFGALLMLQAALLRLSATQSVYGCSAPLVGKGLGTARPQCPCWRVLHPAVLPNPNPHPEAAQPSFSA